jgi:hypothetical protein
MLSCPLMVAHDSARPALICANLPNNVPVGQKLIHLPSAQSEWAH